MLPKNRPPMHPGRLLEKIAKEAGITQAALADKLHVSIGTINTLVNEKRGMTADLAVKLGKAFEASPQMWMNLQTNLDLWHAQHDQTHAG